MKKVFEPVTKYNKDVSEEVTKTITETSTGNNKVTENLDDNLLQIMNARGIIANYLLSPLSNFTNPENANQFKLVKDSTSIRVNDLLIHNTIPITPSNSLLPFRDSGKEFELKGDLLEMITNKKI